MKTVLTTAAALISTATLVAASPANAASQGYDQYRRTVLGDTTIAAPAVATRTELVPGSYAQYLINNGATKSAALNAASQVGEQAGYAAVAVQQPQAKLTPTQAYAKSLGYDGFGSNAKEAVGSAE